jgi:hypothetical protein
MATRKSKLLVKAISTSFCNRGSAMNWRQPISAARDSFVAVTFEKFPTTGAEGRW